MRRLPRLQGFHRVTCGRFWRLGRSRVRPGNRFPRRARGDPGHLQRRDSNVHPHAHVKRGTRTNASFAILGCNQATRTSTARLLRLRTGMTKKQLPPSGLAHRPSRRLSSMLARVPSTLHVVSALANVSGRTRSHSRSHRALGFAFRNVSGSAQSSSRASTRRP